VHFDVYKESSEPLQPLQPLHDPNSSLQKPITEAHLAPLPSSNLPNLLQSSGTNEPMNLSRNQNDKNQVGPCEEKTATSKPWISTDNIPTRSNTALPKLFFGGIPDTISERDLGEYLLDLCEGLGCVGRVINLDMNTGRGFAFVTFNNEDASKAILLSRYVSSAVQTTRRRYFAVRHLYIRALPSNLLSAQQPSHLLLTCLSHLPVSRAYLTRPLTHSPPLAPPYVRFHTVRGQQIEVKQTREQGVHHPDSVNHCEISKYFMGGIHPRCTSQDIRAHFSTLGISIDKAQVMTKEGKSR
jgi:hypothetical protein